MEIQDLSFGLSVVYNSESGNICRTIGFFPGFAQRVRLESYNYKGSFGSIEICQLNQLKGIPVQRSLIEKLGFQEIIDKNSRTSPKDTISTIYSNIFFKKFYFDDKEFNYPFYKMFNLLICDLNAKAIYLQEGEEIDKYEGTYRKQTIIWERPHQELELHFLQKVIWDYFHVDIIKDKVIDKEIFTRHILPSK